MARVSIRRLCDREPSPGVVDSAPRSRECLARGGSATGLGSRQSSSGHRQAKERHQTTGGVCAWAAWALGDGGNRREEMRQEATSFSGSQPANRTGEGLGEARISAQWPVPQRSGSTFGGGTRWLRGSRVRPCAACVSLYRIPHRALTVPDSTQHPAPRNRYQAEGGGKNVPGKRHAGGGRRGGRAVGSVGSGLGTRTARPSID